MQLHYRRRSIVCRARSWGRVMSRGSLPRWLWSAAALFLAAPLSASAGGPSPTVAAFLLADVYVAWKAAHSPAPLDKDTPFIALSAGDFDIGVRQDPTNVYGVEYRFGSRPFWNAQPIAGAAVTPHSSAYAYGGLRFALPVTQNIEVSTDFALAAYSRGNGKDLGSAAEIYFALGASYRFSNNVRLEISGRHVSHGHFVSTYDPGVNMLAIGLAFPLK
jgi:hypothetical protein